VSARTTYVLTALTRGASGSPAKRLVVSFAASMLLAALPGLQPAAVHLSTAPAANPAWLAEFNTWRANAGVTSLTENTTWSAGDAAHALYMVQTGQVTHFESTSYPQYTAAGNTAAQNSNIFVSSSIGAADSQAIDWWMESTCRRKVGALFQLAQS
jgi:uncharacterized protein YkwD